MARIFDIVILAGGRGSRMDGRDKGLVKFQDQPLITHIHRTISHLAQQYHANIFISCNRNIRAYQTYGIPVTDLYPNYLGPLAGIASVLYYMQKTQPDTLAKYLLVVPVDVPYLTIEYLQSLAESVLNDPTEIIVAHDGTHMHPSIMMLQTTLYSSIETCLHSGDFKIKNWILSHAYSLVITTHPKQLENINYPSQLQ